MDHPQGPSGQRSFRRRGLFPIRGEESVTLMVAFAEFNAGNPSGSSQQEPKQHLAQFAGSGNIRLG